MKSISILFMAVSMLAANAAAAENAYDLFQKALLKERTEGNLPEAMKLYQRIVDKFATNRKVAAQALLQLADCHEKLGDAAARKTLERLVRDYGDQNDSADAARVRLAAMGKTGGSSGPTTRLVVAGTGTPSPDGRFLLQYGNSGEVDYRDLKTSQVRRIGTYPGVFDAAVSPDGRRVAAVCKGGDQYEVRVVDIDGSGDRSLWKLDKTWEA